MDQEVGTMVPAFTPSPRWPLADQHSQAQREDRVLGDLRAAHHRLRSGFIRAMMQRLRHSPSLTASQEDIMYVRIVRAQAPPGQVEEVARRWQAFWGTQMPQIPGFRHAHFAAGPETNETISISVWEQRPDAAIMEPLAEQFREQMADISAGPPAFEEYETLADF